MHERKKCPKKIAMKQKPEKIENLWVKFNMEKTNKRSKKAKLYVNASWTVHKTEVAQYIEKNKNKGIAICFLWEELPSQKWEWDVKVIRRYCGGTGDIAEEQEKEAGKKIKKERSNGRIIEESEGKEAKNTMQINNEESIEGCMNSNRLKDQLMIDSKWEWQRRELKKYKKKRRRNIWRKRRTRTTELI